MQHTQEHSDDRMTVCNDWCTITTEHSNSCGYRICSYRICSDGQLRKCNGPVLREPIGGGEAIACKWKYASIQTKEALDCFQQGLPCKKRHRPTLPPVTAIPSALAGLTALFGMGRGRHRRYRHLKIFIDIIMIHIM